MATEALHHFVELALTAFAIEVENATRLGYGVPEPRDARCDVNANRECEGRLPDAGVADEEMPLPLPQQAIDDKVAAA